MNYIVQQYKKFMIAYNHGFKSNVLTVLLYALLSIIWILTSDFLADILFRDYVFSKNIQSIKGIAFVIITSIFLLVLLWKNYNTITRYRDACHKTTSDLKEVQTKQKQEVELYHLMTSYLLNNDIDANDIFIKLFHYIFNQIAICDLASIYQIKNDRVHFIDAIGYDLDTLNSLNLSAENFELHTFALKKHGKCETLLEEKLGPLRYQEYNRNNPQTSESIYVGLVDDQDVKLGISLDISEVAWRNERKTFSDSDIKDLKEFQILLAAMFRMKSMATVKNLLQRDIVHSFISALEHHDEYTKGHSDSVSTISLEIGKVLGLDKDDLQELRWTAMLHDVGKIIIPDTILNKRGRLTDAEFDIVKQHTTTGENFLSKSDSLNDISKYVRHHHERWDGKGYPDGLAGEKIPFFSRIICVADSYHAMISDRPYRKGMSPEDALNEIRANKSTQFCPRVVDAFLTLDMNLPQSISN